MPESENQKNTNYKPFFQSSSSNTLANTEAEIARLTREAIEQIENYQEQIRDAEETKNKIEQLLNKGNLSETAKEKARNKVQSLEDEVADRKANLTRLIESCPSLTAHFNRQAP